MNTIDLKNLKSLEYQTNCTAISEFVWEDLMEGHKEFDQMEEAKTIINNLVKEHIPWLYEELALEFYNPYNYYYTDKHIVLVHSRIEYFLLY